MIAKISTAHVAETKLLANVLNKFSSGQADFPLPACPLLQPSETGIQAHVLNRFIHRCGKLGGKAVTISGSLHDTGLRTAMTSEAATLRVRRVTGNWRSSVSEFEFPASTRRKIGVPPETGLLPDVLNRFIHRCGKLGREA